MMGRITGMIRKVLEPPTKEVFCQFPAHYTVRGSFLIKRLIDIVGASFAIFLSFPFWALAALAIRIEDRGPVFFYQARVGKDGKPFTIVKFRTMVTDAESRKKALLSQSEITGAFKMKNDPRVTRIGRILRKYKVDELPQLLNVLSGSMSLVGPRPTSLEEVKRVYGENSCQKFISGMKPGLTGWTQLKEGIHGKLNLDVQIKHDIEYIEHHSIALDCIIIVLTLPILILGRSE